MQKNIVLLHGWGAETKKLLPLKNKLEKLGWNVYLPELPGFEKPAPKSAWGIQEYSDFIKSKAIEKFGNGEYFVFGHSFGGGIAIKMAAKGAKDMSGIILCASRGISRGKSVKRMMFSTVAKAGKVLLLTPSVGEKFKRLLYKAAREHDYEKLDGIMKDVFKKVISEDLKPYLGKIKIPVLVLWGINDKMTPVKDAHYINKTIRDSLFVEYPNQGHRLPYEKPRQLAKEIDKWSNSII